MNFGNQLHAVVTTTSKENTSLVPELRRWNGEVEEFLASPTSSQIEEAKEECTDESLTTIAFSLRKGMVESICGNHSLLFGADIEEATSLVLENYRERHNLSKMGDFFEFSRTSKNFLRWYIQVALGVRRCVSPSPISTLQSPLLLELLVRVLEQIAIGEKEKDAALARNIALYLFYATYVTFPADEKAREALEYLVEDLQLPELSLRILFNVCNAPLALALVRNLNNAITSLQGGAKAVLTAKVSCESESSSASPRDGVAWLDSKVSTLDFKRACTYIMAWALSSKPPFPGDESDKRSELVTEILSALYAVRGGSSLITGKGDVQLMASVAGLLKWPNDDNDSRIHQNRLSAVSLLMDSEPSFGDFLLEESCFPFLFQLFEEQVDYILTNTRVDNSAATAMVPILVVFNKYASANSVIFALIKDFIFPPDAEAAFLEKSRQQLTKEASGTGRQKKNMTPLDAPKGTLRQKLFSLLTWPEGHIKRCTGELLWTLSSSKPAEFIHRVGFGNAMPILSVKGFINLPRQQS